MKQSIIVERPWGKFEQFTQNETSTVKIIEVCSGKRLSLQSHQYRDEWWIALDDGAVAEISGMQTILRKGEQVLVSRGSKHRLSVAVDSASEKVRVLEIAFGAFDEEDIIRYEDDWGRK